MTVTINNPSGKCPWCGDDPLYNSYHDSEWGRPCFDSQRLFEFLVLEGAQAGLAWITVLRKRDHYYRAYENFHIPTMARWSDHHIEKLMQDTGIIRNRRKLESARCNARAYLKMAEQGLNFSEFLWSFVNHRPLQNRWQAMEEVPATSRESQAMSKALKQAGFNFVGPTICYALMQAVGMVNDHLLSCPQYTICEELSP